jgi:hypothetical protein
MLLIINVFWWYFCFILKASNERPKDWWKSAKSIYEFSAKDIDGHEVSLEKYRLVSLSRIHS